jgi:hypothetical protein
LYATNILFVGLHSVKGNVKIEPFNFIIN